MKPIKVAVVGSRDFDRYLLLKKTLDSHFIDVIVSGGARGADSLAEEYANENNIPTEIYKPDWNKYGKRAGYIRNKDIVDASDYVIAFWDRQSRGTRSTVNLARKAGKRVIIIDI